MKNKAVVIFLASILVLVTIFVYQLFSLSDGKLHIVFCNVGQGDATLIRSPAGKYILIDAGPDRRVLDCLKQYMPIGKHDIDLVILTHPHADHFLGMFDIIRHYTVKRVANEDISNNTTEFKSLLTLLDQNQISYQRLYKNDQYISDSGLIIKALGPTKEFVKQTSPDGMIAESGEFASLILHIKYKDFDLLITGDAQANQLTKDSTGLKNIEVLQVPHHGSKTGLSKDLVKRLNPDLAVISVGKNRYGHPTKEILSLLNEFRITHLQTNNDGPIQIVTDGKTFKITPN